METSKRKIGDIELTIHTVRTLVIGAGMAGLNAAEHLSALGHEDFVIAADSSGVASVDAVSARANYYRMGMTWEQPDSPVAFAKSLVDGGMTHGDNAYVEAVNSIPEFLHLVRNGVPFPRDSFGEFTGSGEKGRVASAGSKTSAIMAEKALAQVKKDKVPMLLRHEVIALLTAGDGAGRHVVGALAVDLRKASNPAESLVLFNCRNVILATGGPSALFANSIYPPGSPSGHALALKAGAAAANVTELRFGLAFAKTRLRLSGILQHAIPSYYSLGKGGRDQKSFLADYFHATKQIGSAIFYKGDHWPFSTAQLQGMGPSVIDIAIHNELAANRRVYVDFTKNIKGENIGQFNVSQLDAPVREFLEANNAVQFTPLDRLRHLDPGLIDRMMDSKIDLREPQEVALCADDSFAGIAVDPWWETRVPHLFAVGDVACTHGNPPDGAQLNAGQVGGQRAAERIAAQYAEAPSPLDTFLAAVTPQLEAEIVNIQRYQYGPIEAPSVKAVRNEITKRMAAHAGMARGATGLAQAIDEARAMYQSFKTAGQRLARAGEFAVAIENELLCLTQIAFLEGMKGYIENGGGSRAAYLILDERGDGTVLTKRGSELRHRNENMGLRNRVIEVTLQQDTEFQVTAVPIRRIPQEALAKQK